MKKTKTWIITCIYLQLLLFVTFGSPCGNPVTDAVNDIEKLIGNIPSDYNISLDYVPDMQSLPKHCWLYLMVHKVSDSLDSFLQKFANNSQNYSIMSNLTMILRGIRHCLRPQLNENMEFIEEFPFSEGIFFPRSYFEYVTKTILAFKDINTDHGSMCVLPSTTEMPESDSKIRVTKPYTRFSYMPSSRKNQDNLIHPKLDPTSSPALETTYMALIALSSLVLGFIIGVVCWKIKHREPRLECEAPAHCTEAKGDAEQKSMLHRTEKANPPV